MGVKIYAIKEIILVFIPPWKHNERNKISNQWNKIWDNILRHEILYRGCFEYIKSCRYQKLYIGQKHLIAQCNMERYMGRLNKSTQTWHSVYIICRLKIARNNNSRILFRNLNKFPLILGGQNMFIQTPEYNLRRLHVTE